MPYLASLKVTFVASILCWAVLYLALFQDIAPGYFPLIETLGEGITVFLASCIVGLYGVADYYSRKKNPIVGAIWAKLYEKISFDTELHLYLVTLGILLIISSLHIIFAFATLILSGQLLEYLVHTYKSDIERILKL